MHWILVLIYSTKLDKCNNVLLPYSRRKIQSYTPLQLLQGWIHAFVRRVLKLINSETGCHIGDTFIGALSYMDDILLLAPTKTSLSKIMSICN